jgi:hypothetical protein
MQGIVEVHIWGVEALPPGLKKVSIALRHSGEGLTFPKSVHLINRAAVEEKERRGFILEVLQLD